MLQRSITLPRPAASYRGPGEGSTVLLLAICAYMMAAVVLVFTLHIIETDALSRVANAYYIIFSRDAHLAAIGFVWGPLPSLALLPLLPFKSAWPALVEQGFAANITSALFMAGGVYILNRILLELGVGKWARLILTASFALHPMIVYYAANGMSEAPLLFFLLLAARYLIRWAQSDQLLALTYTGLAFAGAYLTRYESVFAAIGAFVIVAAISFSRAAGSRRTRFGLGVCDGLIMVAPCFVAASVWAIASWLLVGHPFEHFSSSYGNSSQVSVFKVHGEPITIAHPGLLFAAGIGEGLRRAIYLEPFLLIAVVLALRKTSRAHTAEAIILLGTFLPVLGFLVFAYASGNAVTWLRYFITAIPIGVLMLGLTRLKTGPNSWSAADGKSRAGPSLMRRITQLSLGCIFAGMALLPIPTGALAMSSPQLSNIEAYRIASITSERPSNMDVMLAGNAFSNERRIAVYLDNLRLPTGTVLLDNFLGAAIVLDSRQPHQFVITSDRDFESMLADPAGSGVRYVLVPAPIDLGLLDAVNRMYPRFYYSGAGIARFVREFPNIADSNRNWRLYAIVNGKSY